jgi:hypothetical protein
LAKKSGKFTPKMPFLEKKFSHLLRFSQIWSKIFQKC